MNYFQLFEIPEQIIIDQALLQKKYYELSKKFHPDFYTHSSIEEQNEALENSSFLNTAYQTLKNVYKTIEYILKLNNILQEDEKQSLSPDFLMDMMEVNEELAEAKTIENKPEIKRIKNLIENLEHSLYAAIENKVESYSLETKNENLLKELKEYYFKKKYLNRILEGLE
jgi:molecular chaperone HscB